jgi:dTMP kinase
MVSWVGELEFSRLGLPAPDRQILLDVPVELAAQRAQRREGLEADRARDAYERDAGLQQRTGSVYAGLAARAWHGPWSVAGPDVDPTRLAASLLV